MTKFSRSSLPVRALSFAGLRKNKHMKAANLKFYGGSLNAWNYILPFKISTLFKTGTIFTHRSVSAHFRGTLIIFFIL